MEMNAFQDTYYVPKQTGTYADVLITYGLATLIDRLFQYGKGQHATWRIEIVDDGSYYLVKLSEALQEAWIQKCSFFSSLAPSITSSSKEKPSTSTPTRDVDMTWEQVRAYQQQRSTLWDKGIRGTDLEQQLRDLEPPMDWTIVAYLGDFRMQAMGIYNRIVSQWTSSQEQFSRLLEIFLSLYATPENDVQEVLQEWARMAKEIGVKSQETASQLLNPHQGKGLNEPKANKLRMDNIKDRPWPEEFLKAVGLWACLAPRRVVDTNDWKVYVLAPMRLSFRAHQEAFRRFNRYLWNERRRDETSLKSDITSLLLFNRTWLDYLEAAQRDEYDFDADLDSLAPEKVVAGFHVAQFKLLSRKAYTMVNLSFLNLPAWSGQLQNQAEVRQLKKVIDEHLEVIREIEEARSDGYDLLRHYRDFVAGSNWGAFFDFAASYSHEIIRRYNTGERWVPTFTTSLLRRLMMTNNKPLLPIVENEGFQNVAYAIRHSTVIPQSRKAQNKETLYEIRYGLGAELKRKATVRDEFIVALSNFMQNYNQENTQVLENTQKQMRRDLRTSDIQEVVRLVDEYNSEVVANLLIAFGYAREQREDVETDKVN
jgi:hypothetical protein